MRTIFFKNIAHMFIYPKSLSLQKSEHRISKYTEIFQWDFSLHAC